MELTPRQFEELLCEFCKQDLPRYFTVEHDIKDIGGESGNQRQIDVKIRGKLGVSDILICGEAKNWNGEVGSETIDGLVGKYLSGEIRANKVILFSNNGYSAPAINRAKYLGIELLEPKDIGTPIQNIPYIVAIGYLGLMIIKVSHGGPQESLMTINNEDYIIIKGGEKISFKQNVKRIIVDRLKQIKEKNIYTDLTSFKIKDENVLYELKQKPGYRYYADFEIALTLNWDYFFEYLPAGILRHINTGQLKFVNLQGEAIRILEKVLLSPTKGNYELKTDCIKNVVEKNIAHILFLGMIDPDRQITHPLEPLFDFV